MQDRPNVWIAGQARNDNGHARNDGRRDARDGAAIKPWTMPKLKAAQEISSGAAL